jgi:hypothetical protein
MRKPATLAAALTTEVATAVASAMALLIIPSAISYPGKGSHAKRPTGDSRPEDR